MEYQIKGTPFPVVECHLGANESMITEGGSMVWMSPNMEMKTTGSGGLGRLFSGERIFQNIYTAKGGPGMITFGSSFPGRIEVVDLSAGPWIFQKSAFLASEEGVKLSVHFRKKLGAGFFGGEGFIMQKLEGRGLAFVEIDGELVKYQLKSGQKIVVDTGNVAGFTEGVSMDVQSIKGVSNVLFGGEGLFNTVLTGPGEVWLQTMPISGVAGALIPYIPTGGSN
ncbi:MAG: TIGR00266 family protein [Lachnospiraceae bacterium]|nr:TIGR00266 family protein [Lachnospiraceae bacterium]